jgi:ankyrin repeat protein
MLAEIKTPLNDNEKLQLAQLFEAAYFAVPLEEAADNKDEENVDSLWYALTAARGLLQDAQTDGAEPGLVQRDLERLLLAEIPGSDHWNLLSAAAWAPNSALLAAILSEQPSPDCISWPAEPGTDPPRPHAKHNGLTALHGAACRDDPSRVKLLLDAGAAMHATATNEDLLGQTPAHYALGQQTCSGELIALFIERGADVLQRDANGFTLLHWCVPQYGCKYKLDAAKVILHKMKKESKTADYRAADADTSSALAWCMLNKAKLADAAILPMVQLLLKYGAKPHSCELILKGDTPLQVAEDKKLALCAAAMQSGTAAATQW